MRVSLIAKLETRGLPISAVFQMIDSVEERLKTTYDQSYAKVMQPSGQAKVMQPPSGQLMPYSLGSPTTDEESLLVNFLHQIFLATNLLLL